MQPPRSTSGGVTGPVLKGTSFVDILEWVLEMHGEEGLRRVSKRIKTPASQRALDSPIAFEWYPYASYIEVKRAVCDEFFGGDPKGARVLGAYDANRQMSRIYRFLLRQLSLEFLLKRVPIIVAQTVKGITVTVDVRGPKEVALAFSGYDPLDRVDCEDWAGTLEATASFCKFKNPRVVEEACRLSGAPACVQLVTME